MQVTLSHQKSTESIIKNLEMQMGQLVKQMAERPTRTFVANIKKNPKEECKVIFTRKESVQKKKRIEEYVSKERGDEVSTTKTKTKSQLAREARKEIPSVLVKNVPYPLVPSKNDNERYFIVDAFIYQIPEELLHKEREIYQQ